MMKLSSRLAMINGAAPIIAPVLGSVLLAWIDWRGIFVVLACYAVVIVVSTAIVIPETLPVASRATGGFSRLAVVARELASDRIFVSLMFVGGMIWGSEFSYLAGSSFLLQDRYGFSATQFGLVFAINALGYVVGTQLGARIAHRFPPQRLLAIATQVMAAAAAIVTVGIVFDVRPLVLAAMWFSVAAVGVGIPCANALALNRVTHSVGTAAAMLGAANFGIAALVTPLASVGSATSSLGMGVVMLVTAVIAAVFALMLRGRQLGWPVPVAA
jgi:DHA1 family bicyclomycin/chloramphenicol resistance-like MFS transporter